MNLLLPLCCLRQMKLIIFFSFLLVFNNVLGSELILSENNSKNRFIYDFALPDCAVNFDCSLFIGRVNDGLRVRLNDQIIHNEFDQYLGFDSITIPLPTQYLKTKNKLEIDTRGFREWIPGVGKEIFIGSSSKVRISKYVDLIKRSGFTLGSIHVLFVFLAMLFPVFISTLDRRFLGVIIYSLISSLYLLSFTEIPRYFLSPEVLSGAVHFPLRLLQDMALVYLFQLILGGKNSTKVFKLSMLVYTGAILSMVAPAFVGYHSYSFHLNIILIVAPLVAFPMGFGLFLALKNISRFERRILNPAMVILFVLQLNDLFVFWRFYPGFFTVKLYIPFVIALLLYIHLERKIEDYQSNKILALKSRLAMQIAHDIKSPLTAIKTVLAGVNIEDEQLQKILDMSFHRMNKISESMLPGFIQLEDIALQESM